jgi:hypothetical protein
MRCERPRELPRFARLAPGAPLEETLERLQSIEGIGPWTAQYPGLQYPVTGHGIHGKTGGCGQW